MPPKKFRFGLPNHAQRMKRARAAENDYQRNKRRKKDAEWHAASRMLESQEQREVRRKLNAQRAAAARRAENRKETERRRTLNAQRAAAPRQAENREETDRRRRLNAQRRRTLNARRAENREETERKRRLNAQSTAALRQAETRNKKNEIQHLGEEHKNKKLKSQQSDDKWQMNSTLSSPKTSKCVHLTPKIPAQQDSSLAQASQNITMPAQVLATPLQITVSKSKLVENPNQATVSKSNSSLVQASQNITKQAQVLATPLQIAASKSKLVKNPNQTTVSESIIRKKDLLRQKLLVTSHQPCVMSNLASMRKNEKLCDASISNGSSTVKVHKIILSAVSPKLFSVFSTYVSSQFYEVKFPEVSTETLMAFVEYIYTGLLDLDLNILQEIKVIAKKLDMKDLENLCDVHLLSGARQQLASTVTAFDDPKQIPSYVSAITTEDIKQEISQNELPELKEDTDRIFEQQIEDTSMDTKGGNSPAGSIILPTVKIESVGPDDDKYGQMNKRTSVSSSVSDTSQALNTTLNPIAVSTTDFGLPFTNTTNNNTTANKIHGTSPKLKSDVSEGSLVSDLSSLSYSDEKLCSQSRLNKEEPSEPLNQTITTQSIDNNVTSGSNEGVYPVGFFTTGGDRLPLSSTQITSVKNIGLYKIDGFT